MPHILLAIDTGLEVTRTHAGYSGTSGEITVIIGQAIQVLLGVLGVAFLAFLLYGGILWMIAAGDKTKVEKATKLITNSVIAVVVIVASYAISTYVLQALTTAVSG